MKKWGILMVLLVSFLLGGCSSTWQQGEVVVIQDEQVTIHILAGQSTSDAGSEELIDRVLREKFPEVDFQWTCVDWGDGFGPQMTGKFAAGQMPDILIGKAQDVPVYQALGALEPLDREACVGIDPDALELVTVDGDIYGLPYNVLYQGVLYNKCIFEDLGLDVPETRQELEQVVALCEAAGYTAFGLHFGDVWSIGNLNMQLWMNDLFLQYPNWTDIMQDKQTSFLQEVLVADAFRQCQYMLAHSHADAVQIDQSECIKRFSQGESAMFMTGTWSLQDLAHQNPELEVGIFPYPNTSGNARLLEETNLTFMKGSSGKNEELVDRVLLEIGTNLELAQEIAEFTSANSTFVSLRGTDLTFIERLSAPYEAAERIANVSVGNNQFVWSFQNAVAEQTLAWLGGKIGLNQLLFFADESLNMY